MTAPYIRRNDSVTSPSGTRFGVHVPTVRNDGTPVDPAYFDALHARILNFADGFTFTQATGGWRGTDRVYVEPVRVYLIDLPTRDPSEALLNFARTVRDELSQECVYLTREPLTAECV